MSRSTCQDVVVPINTESTADDVLQAAKRTFDEHGLQKLRPNQSFVLKKDNVILAQSSHELEQVECLQDALFTALQRSVEAFGKASGCFLTSEPLSC